VAICLILQLVFETVNLALTLYKLAQQRKYGNSPLLQSIVNKGILAYLYLLGSSVVNLAILYTLPPELRASLFVTHRVLHVVLTERLILHIRSAATYAKYGSKADTGPGEFRFAAPPNQSTQVLDSIVIGRSTT